MVRQVRFKWGISSDSKELRPHVIEIKKQSRGLRLSDPYRELLYKFEYDKLEKLKTQQRKYERLRLGQINYKHLCVLIFASAFLFSSITLVVFVLRRFFF